MGWPGTRPEVPDHRLSAELPNLKIFNGSHPDGGSLGIDRRDVSGAAISGGPDQPQSLALTDGELMHAGMGRQHTAVRVHHIPRRTPIRAPRNAWVSPEGMKQMS